MSKDKCMMKTTSAIIPPIKILPAQVTRLKKEEDEETWISGEELQTEGSSDEETCKSNMTLERTTNSTLTPKCHRLKTRRDQTTKNPVSQLSLSQVVETLALPSTSTEFSPKIESNIEVDSAEDDEISWKVNRESLDDEIVALQQHEQQYPEICSSIEKIFEEYLEKIDYFNDVAHEQLVRKNRKFEEEMKTNIQFLDQAIDKMQIEVEAVKRKTRQTQLKNRLRLKEIIMQGPPETKRLAKNTEGFIKLYSGDKITNSSDHFCNEMLQFTDESESSKLSQVKMKHLKSLEIPISSGDTLSNISPISNIIPNSSGDTSSISQISNIIPNSSADNLSNISQISNIIPNSSGDILSNISPISNIIPNYSGDNLSNISPISNFIPNSSGDI